MPRSARSANALLGSWHGKEILGGHSTLADGCRKPPFAMRWPAPHSVRPFAGIWWLLPPTLRDRLIGWLTLKAVIHRRWRFRKDKAVGAQAARGSGPRRDACPTVDPVLAWCAARSSPRAMTAGRDPLVARAGVSPPVRAHGRAIGQRKTGCLCSTPSGSTGKPKRVVHNHRRLQNLCGPDSPSSGSFRPARRRRHWCTGRRGL